MIQIIYEGDGLIAITIPPFILCLLINEIVEASSDLVSLAYAWWSFDPNASNVEASNRGLNITLIADEALPDFVIILEELWTLIPNMLCKVPG